MDKYEADLTQDILETKNQITELMLIKELSKSLATLKKNRDFKLVIEDTFLGSSLKAALARKGGNVPNSPNHELAGAFINGCAILVKFFQDLEDSVKIADSSLIGAEQNLVALENELAALRGGR